MKQLTKEQSKIVARKIYDFAEMLVYTHEPGKMGRIIARIEMLTEMITNGYDEIYNFEEAFKNISAV